MGNSCHCCSNEIYTDNEKYWKKILHLYVNFLVELKNTQNITKTIENLKKLPEPIDPIFTTKPIINRLINVIQLLHPTEDLTLSKYNLDWYIKQCLSQYEFAIKAEEYFTEYSIVFYEYDRFMKYIKKYDTYVVAPTIPADLLFHALMIFDTINYQKLCTEQFGKILCHTTDDVPIVDNLAKTSTYKHKNDNGTSTDWILMVPLIPNNNYGHNGHSCGGHANHSCGGHASHGCASHG